jgi:cell division septum initiation protein DivIVA
VHAEAESVRREADDHAVTVRGEATIDASRMATEAEEGAKEVRSAALDDARAIIAEAHTAAREVLRDGTQLSGHLRELSDALRTNADRLLRDVKLAHATLTSRLDAADPGARPPGPTASRGSGRSRAASREPVVDLDVPEFIPPR